MTFRDHQPVVISDFNGLYDRDSPDNVPLDHFTICENIKFVGADISNRDGVGLSQAVSTPLINVKRIYNYPTQQGNTLLVLTYDGVTGKVHHVVDSSTTYEILSIAGMEDFAFVPYAGRAYISPFKSFAVGSLNVEKGMSGEFLYVYLGAGAVARKAAGAGIAGIITVAAGAVGHTDAGNHIYGFVYETDTGYLSAPYGLKTFINIATNSVSFGAVPTTGSPSVTKRHLVASKKIDSFNGDLLGYTLYFVPNATINNDVDNFLNNISFYDADLLDDASHLTENYPDIPAGSHLSLYHNRLVLGCTFNDISLVLVSAVGEPEAIDQIDGLLVVPLDGNPVTNAQEYRDILYVFKRARTVSFIDNNDVPSSWPMSVVDNALGTSVHGIATVLDSGSSTIDFLIIATYQGISLFNGRYITPELSWKVERLWRAQLRSEFRRIQIVNEPIHKEFYCTLPDKRLLVANYENGMDPRKIRWSIWTFEMTVNTVAIQNIDDIILGSDYTPPPPEMAF